MKLRCTTNSIRIRIRKSELSTLINDRQIEESILLSPEVTFRFSLAIVDIPTVAAVYEEASIQVQLPIEQAKEWATTQQVGIEVNNLIHGDQSLHLLIEKDFPCLDREEEDYNDTFFELSEQDTDSKC